MTLYSGHAENSQTWKKGKSGEKNPASSTKTREERGWNVAVNSGWRDARISSYVWRPYFFHDDSGGRLTESRNFGTAPNYYRPVCFTLYPIGLLSVTSFSLPNRVQKGLRKFSNRCNFTLGKPWNERLLRRAPRETSSIAFSRILAASRSTSFEFQIYLDPRLSRAFFSLEERSLFTKFKYITMMYSESRRKF